MRVVLDFLLGISILAIVIFIVELAIGLFAVLFFVFVLFYASFVIETLETMSMMVVIL